MTANLRHTYAHRYDFVGATTYVASGSASPIPWRSTVVGGGTVANVANGARFTLTATNEAQSARLSFADVLSYDIDDLISIRTRFQIASAAFGSSIVFIGLASAGNATIDTISHMAGFRLEANFNLLIETDDNVIDNNDIPAGLVIEQNRWYDLVIDFAEGVQTVGPPGISKGGKGSVLFKAGNTTTGLRQRAVNQLFDMSNYSGGLQPYIQYQKASSTDAGTMDVDFFEVITRGRN